MLFNVSGYLNARCINDSETDTSIITENDWAEDLITDRTHDILKPMSPVKKQFFIQNCHLSILSEFSASSPSTWLTGMSQRPSSYEYHETEISYSLAILLMNLQKKSRHGVASFQTTFYQTGSGRGTAQISGSLFCWHSVIGSSVSSIEL